MIAITTAMPIVGHLSDVVGRKKVFIVSLTLFILSSAACGLAPNIQSLIAFRFLQGVGGASFLPTAAGIVSDLFPQNRERAIGFFTSIFPIGGIIGPNLGGLIISRYSWRYIFYINVPLGIFLLILIVSLLKESKVYSPVRIDYTGALLFLGMVVFLMLGLNVISEKFSMPRLYLTIVFLSISLFFLYLFFLQEKANPSPIIDIALLKLPPFMAANLYNMVIGVGVFGVFAFIPLFALSVHKLSTFASGAILTPRSIGTIPASFVISFFLKRWGYRKPMIWGLIIISISMILLADQKFQLLGYLGIRLNAIALLALMIMVSGIGMGIVFPASNNACIELMPDRVATITGLRGMFRTIGGALGISVITIILHVSSSPTIGFRIIFICSGIILLLTIPLVFLMPGGPKKEMKNYL